MKRIRKQFRFPLALAKAIDEIRTRSFSEWVYEACWEKLRNNTKKQS